MTKGGARPNAGRKPKPEPTYRITVSMPKSLKPQIDDLGGSRMVKRLLWEKLEPKLPDNCGTGHCSCIECLKPNPKKEKKK